MTKKDYIKIAKILKTTDLAAHQRASLAVSFASVCKEDNPRFDIQRFLTACGVENPKVEVKVLDKEEKFVQRVHEVLEHAKAHRDAFKNVPKRL
jgi:uncharacterized protein YciW